MHCRSLDLHILKTSCIPFPFSLLLRWRRPCLGLNRKGVALRWHSGSRPGLPPVIRASSWARTSVDVVHQGGEAGEGHPLNCTLGHSKRNVWGLRPCYTHTHPEMLIHTHSLLLFLFSSLVLLCSPPPIHPPLRRRPLIGTLAASVGVEGMSERHAIARNPQTSPEQYEDPGEKQRRRCAPCFTASFDHYIIKCSWRNKLQMQNS